MAEGFRYVWNWRGIRFLFIVLGAVRFLLVPSFTLLPLLVTKYFGGEVLELGWINSAHGFGFVAGGFILSLWGGFRRQTLTALIGLVGVGFGMIAFGLVPANAFWLAVVIMFARTSMVPIVRGPILAIFQIHVPPELQGRVFTLLVSAMSVMAPLGLAIGGPVAEAFGVRSLFILAGLGCLLIALIWVSSPTIMHLEDQTRLQSVGVDAPEVS
jgi:DHA3 family macrolide efflux protein-like MFS transporter